MKMIKSSKCGSVILYAVVLGSIINSANGKGILFPQDSETRERKSLDGIWNFRIAARLDPEIGFREEWFKRPLSEVGM